MSGEEIIKINKVGDLFHNDINSCKSHYRDLVKQWHPDVNKIDTTDIFLHINMLYNRALELLDKGLWEATNYIELSTKNNKKIYIKYLDSWEFELGFCYVCNNCIIYKFYKDKEKYYLNALKMAQFNFSDMNMEKEFGRFLPKIINNYTTIEDEYCIVIEKTKDIYPLKNLLRYMNNSIEDRHVTWMISRLSNLSCYLEFTGVVHNGICLDNCFVSPKFHSIMLYGGWWYSTNDNQKMIGTTKDIYDIMPVICKTNKISNRITDLESIKLLGRELLGERNCRKLISNNIIPKQIIDFMISGSNKSSYEEMKKWDETVNKSYGKRQFIELIINENNMYNK